MTENNSGATYRLADSSDHPFVYSSFLKSYRDSPMVRGVPNTIYFSKQHDLIERFLTRASALPIVACSAKDPTQIYGYILGERTANGLVVHWVYVKQPFRSMGIAAGLFDKLTAQADDIEAIYYTHRVKTVEGLLKNRSHVTFNPYLLMELK